MEIGNRDELRSFLLDINSWKKSEIKNKWDWKNDWESLQEKGLVETFFSIKGNLGLALNECLRLKSPLAATEAMFFALKGKYLVEDNHGELAWSLIGSEIQSTWVEGVCSAFNAFDKDFIFTYGDKILKIDEINFKRFLTNIQDGNKKIQSSNMISKIEKDEVKIHIKQIKKAVAHKNWVKFKGLVKKILPYMKYLKIAVDVASPIVGMVT